jgi:hypothetical protein
MSKLLDKLIPALFEIPHYHNSDGGLNANYPIQSDRWRNKVAAAIVLMAGFNLFAGTALLYLFLTMARADDLNAVEARLIAEKIEQVSTTICMAEAGTVDQQLRAYQSTLQEQYHDLVGRDYVAPECDILLKLRE